VPQITIDQRQSSSGIPSSSFPGNFLACVHASVCRFPSLRFARNRSREIESLISRMKFDPPPKRRALQHPRARIQRASPYETSSRMINEVPVKTLIALAASVLGVTIESPIASRMKEGWLVDNAPKWTNERSIGGVRMCGGGARFRPIQVRTMSRGRFIAETPVCLRSARDRSLRLACERGLIPSADYDDAWGACPDTVTSAHPRYAFSQNRRETDQTHRDPSARGY